MSAVVARRLLGAGLVAVVAAAAGACGTESSTPPTPATVQPATTAAPGTTRPVGRTTTTVAGTTLPRPGGTPGTLQGAVSVEGDLARRDAALCVEARQVAEGPLPRDRVDAAAAHLPAAFAALPAAGDQAELQREAATRFASGAGALLAAPDAGQGGGRGAMPEPFVWPAGADAGLDACFVRAPDDPAPLTVRLPAIAARPPDDAALEALFRTELAVVDPFGYLATGGACIDEQVTARRAAFGSLIREASASGWADGMGRLAAEVAGACGAAVAPVAADGTDGTLVFLAPPGTFAGGSGPRV